MAEKKKLIILSGPTAAGKTELSISLAKTVGGEIISADSMQVYKMMDIGSAKIRHEEMQGVKHHLVDIIDPSMEWSVSHFYDNARKAMTGIYERGHIPIIVGGTGFYIQSVLYSIDFTKENNTDEVRAKLNEFLAQSGPHALHERLREVDPESAEEIHENNTKRTMRALEYFLMTGEKISVHNKRERQKESEYNFAYFVLDMDRELLYNRIDRRVDIMLKDGLVDEVKRLRDLGFDRSYVSMQGLGYKEILAYLDGEISLEDAVYIIKRDTRHFAKRQMTWFRREKDVYYLKKDENTMTQTLLDEIVIELNKKGYDI